MKDESKFKNAGREEAYDSSYAKDHEKEDPENHLEFKEVLKLYKPDSTQKILEIGCNTGEFCYLLKNKFNVTPLGIDINDEAIEIASKKYPELDFQVKDIFKLDNNYDVIYMQHVIEHLDPNKVLIKLREILDDKGTLIITCPNKWAYPAKLICKIKGTKFCYDPTHLHEFDPVSLPKIIENTGFKPIKVITKPLNIPFISRISINLQSRIPAYLFGDFIFILAEKEF